MKPDLCQPRLQADLKALKESLERLEIGPSIMDAIARDAARSHNYTYLLQKFQSASTTAQAEKSLTVKGNVPQAATSVRAPPTREASEARTNASASSAESEHTAAASQGSTSMSEPMKSSFDTFNADVDSKLIESSFDTQPTTGASQATVQATVTETEPAHSLAPHPAKASTTSALGNPVVGTDTGKSSATSLSGAGNQRFYTWNVPKEGSPLPSDLSKKAYRYHRKEDELITEYLDITAIDNWLTAKNLPKVEVQKTDGHHYLKTDQWTAKTRHMIGFLDSRPSTREALVATFVRKFFNLINEVILDRQEVHDWHCALPSSDVRVKDNLGHACHIRALHEVRDSVVTCFGRHLTDLAVASSHK